jgi:hypothetical protein
LFRLRIVDVDTECALQACDRGRGIADGELTFRDLPMREP